MWQNQSKTHFLFAIALVFLAAHFLPRVARGDGESLWVQAVQADLKQAPQMGAKSVGKLSRGEKLSVSKKEGLWIEVQSRLGKGWVSKLFVLDHPPVGSADLSKDIDTSTEKSSRRRPNSYTVAASTRGLRAEGKGRNFGEANPPDYSALDEMEHYKLDEAKLSAFKAEARLGEM